MKRFAIGVVLSALLVQCGVTYDSVDGATTSTDHQLVLFSTPWCEPCEVLLPQLDAQLAGSGIKFETDPKLFIVTGAKSSQPPSDEIAAQYKHKLDLTIETAPDPWKWTIYKKYYGASGVRVPGAVVLSQSGAVIKVFPPGGFDAAEVVSFLKSSAR